MNKGILGIGILVLGLSGYLYFYTPIVGEVKLVTLEEKLQKSKLEKEERKKIVKLKSEKEVKTKNIRKKEVEIVRGYKLPPEPDEKLNNSTLLGIDSNNNMLRDDVERWVVNQPWSDQRIAVTLQNMRGLQILIDEDFGTNKRRASFSSLSTTAYRSLYRQGINTVLDDNKKLRNIMYNTTDRKKAYREYDRSFSGTITYGFPRNDKFGYKYADYTMEDGTLSSYKFNADIYSTEELIPLYSEEDGLIMSYWNIEKKDTQDFNGSWNDKFCEINFGISESGRECTIAEENYQKEIKRGVGK